MSGSTALQTFTILNFLLQKWRLFHVKFQTKTSFIMVLIRPCQKVYEQNFTFQYKILKFSSKSRILPTFTIFNILLQKWRPSQYNIKIGKRTIFIAFTSPLWKNVMKKPLFFNSYFQNLFQNIMLCRVLKSQTLSIKMTVLSI